MKRHLVFDIGCIECGEESAVVGIYYDRDAAAAAKLAYLDGDNDWGGQHSVEVFEVDIP